MLKLPPPYLENLMETFLNFYSPLSSLYSQNNLSYEKRLLAEKVLRFFDIDYDVYTNTFTWQDQTIDCKQLFKSTISNKITPKPLNYNDLQDLQEILSKPENITTTPSLGPLLESIGWTIEILETKVRLHFVGGPTYDSWKISNYENDIVNWQDLIEVPDKWTKGWKPDWLQRNNN